MAMAEPVALEIRGLGLDRLWPHAPDCYYPPETDSPPKADSPQRSASWSNFSLFGFTDDSVANKVEVKTKPAANKVEVKTKPAASVEAKNKAASATSFFIGPAARVEGKEASACFIKPAASFQVTAASAGKPAAKVEGAASASIIEPASSLEGKPEPAATVKGKTKLAARKPEPPKPKVVAVKTEMMDEDDIQWMLKHPISRPKPLPEIFFESRPHLREQLTASYAGMNKVVDVRDDIKKQYFDKGYAIVGVEYLDNGRKRLFSVPEEARLRFAGERAA